MTDQHFSKIYISHHCKEGESEICTIQLVPKTSNLIILSSYRTPSGDLNGFLRRLHTILKYLYNPKFEFIISFILLNVINILVILFTTLRKLKLNTVAYVFTDSNP
jgi:hypothetical protein